MSEQDFERRLGYHLRQFASQGVRPFDAAEVVRLATAGHGRSEAIITTQRRPEPSSAMWLLATTLLLVGIIATSTLVAGWVRLPAQVGGESPTPEGSVVLPSSSPGPSLSAQPLPSSPPIASPTAAPSAVPSAAPSNPADPAATGEPSPAASESAAPSPIPSLTSEPTLAPSAAPTSDPTVGPSVAPTADPSVVPSVAPSVAPSVDPTDETIDEPPVEPSVDPAGQTPAGTAP